MTKGFHPRDEDKTLSKRRGTSIVLMRFEEKLKSFCPLSFSRKPLQSLSDPSFFRTSVFQSKIGLR